ncbi:MAG: signal recognition particle-docking protein FtsY [Legionellales bacterium]|nr:signal recognition particle-docking protein FtsY [Legionellales bacterium]
MIFNLFKEKSAAGKIGYFTKIKNSLKKTREAFLPNNKILTDSDLSLDDVFVDVENRLLMADVGIDVTDMVINLLREKVSSHKECNIELIRLSIKEILKNILNPCEKPLVIEQSEPYVILFIGINGAGKTTTIGKIAHLLQQQGDSCLIAAGDTFRAAATEQVAVWGERNGIPVISQSHGADSASVIHDAITAAKARNIKVVLADTAGRLHTQQNLMSELSKIKRVIKKCHNSAPHEIMLVVDASIGQNSLKQAEIFHKEIGLTGITVTKLDGTAKGGIIVKIAHDLKIPIRYIGTGESISDLCAFNADTFINALVD